MLTYQTVTNKMLTIWLAISKKKLEELRYVTLNDMSDEVILEGLLRVTFVRKAGGSHTKSILTRILIYIDENLI